MSRKLSLILSILTALIFTGAALETRAQVSSAVVVPSCGSVTYTAGKSAAMTQDTTGKACGGASVTGSITANQGNAGSSAWPIKIDQTTQGTTNGVQLRTGSNVVGGVTQSGTWTVQPGNTANTTAWKVDNSAVTQPSSIADGADVTLGSLTDSAWNGVSASSTTQSYMRALVTRGLSTDPVAVSVPSPITSGVNAAEPDIVTISASGVGETYVTSGYQGVQFSIMANASANTYTFEGSVDDVSWFTIYGVSLDGVPYDNPDGKASATVRTYQFNNIPAYVRWSIAGYTGGSTTIATTLMGQAGIPIQPSPSKYGWKASVSLTDTTNTTLKAACPSLLVNYLDSLTISGVATTTPVTVSINDTATPIWSINHPGGAVTIPIVWNSTMPLFGSIIAPMRVQLGGSPTGAIQVNASGHCGL